MWAWSCGSWAACAAGGRHDRCHRSCWQSWWHMQVVLGTWQLDGRCTARGAACARPGLDLTLQRWLCHLARQQARGMHVCGGARQLELWHTKRCVVSCGDSGAERCSCVGVQLCWCTAVLVQQCTSCLPASPPACSASDPPSHASASACGTKIPISSLEKGTTDSIQRAMWVVVDVHVL
jgi:hypothetical protein